MGANQMESKVFNATFCSVSFKIQSIVDPQLSVRMCVPKFENSSFSGCMLRGWFRFSHVRFVQLHVGQVTNKPRLQDYLERKYFLCFEMYLLNHLFFPIYQYLHLM